MVYNIFIVYGHEETRLSSVYITPKLRKTLLSILFVAQIGKSYKWNSVFHK